MGGNTIDIAAVLAKAEAGVRGYLEAAARDGKISQGQLEMALGAALPNLRDWLNDPHIDRISPNLKAGLADAVAAGQWEDITNAYRQAMRFGTGGIRGMMAYDRASIVKMQDDGLDARILKGPNTLNNIVVLKCSAGVAKFGKSPGRGFDRIVIGYDSRVRGGDIARVIAELFLAYDYTVYLFDEPCPYPEVTFGIPSKDIKAQIGLLISASHNDYRYNGYKLSCGNGSQFDPVDRDAMYEQFISKATTTDIKLCPLDQAPKGKLVWLGGSEPVEGKDYYGAPVLDLHSQYAAQVQSFMKEPGIAGTLKSPLKIAYCAYHGAGRKLVPRLLAGAGFNDVKIIHEAGLYDLNGLFPSVCSDPGKEQQPDPGDPRTAKTAVDAFNKEYPGEFKNIDVQLGTDPDADRSAIVVKVPKEQQPLFGNQDWALLPADEMWALLIWYRLQREMEANGGKVPDADKKFLVLSHTTTDTIVKLCKRYGIGVIKTYVGFAALSAAVRDQWEARPRQNLVEGRANASDALCHPYILEYTDMSDARTLNIGTLEQSNGFSILGGPPPDAFSLGAGGHCRDKDGTFASLLSAEVAAWAKREGMGLIELLDEKIYLDPAVGLFVNHYEPDPLDGEYPGIEGDKKKIAILNAALELDCAVHAGKTVEIGGKRVLGAAMYRTGKYDKLYPPTGDFVFPDEGIRFYFSEDKLDHLTVRPSGTGNSLRFHTQLHADVTKANLVDRKAALRKAALAVTDDIREKLGAPR